jgi:hypothetical protein
LLLRAVFTKLSHLVYRRKLAALCVTHLTQIRDDLKSHVKISGEQVVFSETNYNEAAVGHFLYDLFTANIDKFANLASINNTVTFFHHYKVNMSTVRSRLDSGKGDFANLTKGTFDNLLNYLEQAIDELQGLASGPVSRTTA